MQPADSKLTACVVTAQSKAIYTTLGSTTVVLLVCPPQYQHPVPCLYTISFADARRPMKMGKGAAETTWASINLVISSYTAHLQCSVVQADDIWIIELEKPVWPMLAMSSSISKL